MCRLALGRALRRRPIVIFPQHCILPLLGPRPPGDFPTQREPLATSRGSLQRSAHARHSFLPGGSSSELRYVWLLLSPGSYCRSSFLDRKAVRLEHKVTTSGSDFRICESVTAQVEAVDAHDSVRCFLRATCVATRCISGFVRPIRGNGNAHASSCRRVDPLRRVGSIRPLRRRRRRRPVKPDAAARTTAPARRPTRRLTRPGPVIQRAFV